MKKIELLPHLKERLASRGIYEEDIYDMLNDPKLQTIVQDVSIDRYKSCNLKDYGYTQMQKSYLVIVHTSLKKATVKIVTTFNRSRKGLEIDGFKIDS